VESLNPEEVACLELVTNGEWLAMGASGRSILFQGGKCNITVCAGGKGSSGGGEFTHLPVVGMDTALIQDQPQGGRTADAKGIKYSIHSRKRGGEDKPFSWWAGESQKPTGSAKGGEKIVFPSGFELKRGQRVAEKGGKEPTKWEWKHCASGKKSFRGLDKTSLGA